MLSLRVSPGACQCQHSFVYSFLGITLQVRHLHDQQGIRTAVVSNGDSRIRGWHLALSYTCHSRQAGCRQGAERLEFSGLSSARCAQ